VGPLRPRVLPRLTIQVTGHVFCEITHITAYRGLSRASLDTLVGMFVTALVNLYTRDIEAGIRFYRDLLGFEEAFRTPREGTPSHIEFRLEGFTLGLGTVEAARRVHGVEAAPGSPAMVLVVWTDDVDKSYEDLVAAGVPSVQAPHDTGNNNRNALLRDPDGNLVEIVAKRS
jgi:lactoylglutathione lyase